MRYLVLYAHPNPESYASALHRCVVQTLRKAGHVVDDCDLYAERFAPVMSRAERRKYNDENASHPEVEKYIDRLMAAQGLVFIFPTWWYGMPAILKGYLDRVWLPGVAFKMVDGVPVSLVHHIQRLAVVTTYGSPRSLNEGAVDNPTRHALMKGLGNLVSKSSRKLWVARYGMDTIGEAARDRFLEVVRKKIRALAR